MRLIPKHQSGNIVQYNTTSEFSFDPKTMKSVRNPNAQMGLEQVSPEFMLLTGGVGVLSNKAITTVGKIGKTMLHGAGQGAVANMSNLSGSKQNVEGLTTDILGGALVGGALKGIGIGTKKSVPYVLNKVEPYLLGEKSIPMMKGYKPIRSVIDPSDYGTAYQEAIKNEFANKQRMLWRSQGHDVNMSDEAIIKHMDAREAEILKTGPKQFLIDKPLKSSPNGGQIVLFQRPYTKPYDVGFLNYDKSGPIDPGYMKIDFIKNMQNPNILKSDRISVSKPLYQGLLNKAKQTNEEGFLTGLDYKMPEKTVPTIKNNFETEVSTKRRGTRRYKEDDFTSMSDREDINEIGEYRPATHDHDVYKVNKFKTPMTTPMKSVLSASPTTKLDWSNPDIYKSVLAIIGSGTLTSKINNNKKAEHN